MMAKYNSERREVEMMRMETSSMKEEWKCASMESYGVICDDGWDEQDAAVACSSMGYSTPVFSVSRVKTSLQL